MMRAGIRACVCGGLLVLVAVGAAQADAVTIAPTNTGALDAATAAGEPEQFWPDLSRSTLAWFAVVVILALTLRLKPLLSLRNLDALVLAGMCLLLGLRGDPRLVAGSALTLQGWSYLLLTVAAAYWVVRGAGLLIAGGAAQPERNVSASAMTVLLLVGLGIGVHHIATAPISQASRDGIVGGLCTAATGKLPYGDTPGYDGRSPLLYLLHAGAVWTSEPMFSAPGSGGTQPMTWQNRAAWLGAGQWDWEDTSAARLVNALLFVGVLLGLYVIGRQLHSAAAGPTMMAIFCVFPGVLECLPRPDIMLSTLLMTWTIAFALIPAAGGLLATLCLVLAGIGWPWAWLGLPVLLAYFWRRGWQAVGSSLGLLGGAALAGVGLLALVQPTMPRPDGALAIAGVDPSYAAHTAEGQIVVADPPVASTAAESRAYSAFLWRRLLDREATTMENTAETRQINWPNGVSARKVLYRTVAATAGARAALQPSYRAAIGELPGFTRTLVSLRTVLEATWLPVHSPQSDITPAWNLWNGPGPLEGSWLLTRRLVKAGLALLSVGLALLTFFGRRARPRHVVAGLLAVSAAALIASAPGAVVNLAWLLPLILALWALSDTPDSQLDAVESGVFADSMGVSGEDGAAPRITLEN